MSGKTPHEENQKQKNYQRETELYIGRQLIECAAGYLSASAAPCRAAVAMHGLRLEHLLIGVDCLTQKPIRFVCTEGIIVALNGSQFTEFINFEKLTADFFGNNATKIKTLNHLLGIAIRNIVATAKTPNQEFQSLA